MISVPMLAALVGSVLPDVPFTLLTIAYGGYYMFNGRFPDAYSAMIYLHFTRFFSDPIWIIGHNMFHSVVINSVLVVVGYAGMRRHDRWGVPLFWLALSMLTHTVFDIVTHHSDGPLFLFPLNWTYRFASPVSNSEAGYYGGIITIIEYAVDVLIIGYLAVVWLRRRRYA